MFFLNLIFSLKDLERFLSSKGADRIIEKGRSASGLSDDDRKTVVSLLHDYLKGKCSKIERHHMVTVAKLLIFLMPKLKDDSKGEHAGYVSGINCVNCSHFLQ